MEKIRLTSWYGKYPLFAGCHTCQVVQDFFHQQYHVQRFLLFGFRNVRNISSKNWNLSDKWDDLQVPCSVSMDLLLPSPTNPQVPWGDSLALERHGASWQWCCADIFRVFAQWKLWCSDFLRPSSDQHVEDAAPAISGSFVHLNLVLWSFPSATGYPFLPAEIEAPSIYASWMNTICWNVTVFAAQKRFLF